MVNTSLKEIKAYKSKGGLWYLKLVYEYTDEKGTHLVIFPKAALPFAQSYVPEICFSPYLPGEATCPPYLDCDDHMNLYRGTSALAAERGVGSESVAFNIITEPAEPKEMTLEEIEKKLGYRVKVVSKEE